MSLIAYAFGGALEGAGKGLAKVGEHRRFVESEPAHQIAQHGTLSKKARSR